MMKGSQRIATGEAEELRYFVQETHLRHSKLLALFSSSQARRSLIFAANDA